MLTEFLLFLYEETAERRLKSVDQVEHAVAGLNHCCSKLNDINLPRQRANVFLRTETRHLQMRAGKKRSFLAN